MNVRDEKKETAVHEEINSFHLEDAVGADLKKAADAVEREKHDAEARQTLLGTVTLHVRDLREKLQLSNETTQAALAVFKKGLNRSWNDLRCAVKDAQYELKKRH